MVNNTIKTEGLPDEPVSLKPFRLVKFFSFTGLGVVLLFTFILSWLVSNYSQRVSLERSTEYAILQAENLNNQIFLQFVLPIAFQGEEIRLRKQQQFKKLDTIVRNVIHGLKIDSVTIFDSSENIISYSTNNELLGKKDLGGKEYERALNGTNSTNLSSTGSLLSLLPGSKPISSKLTTFIPFRPEKQPDDKSQIIIGVTEIVLDLSEDFSAIIRMQATIVITSIVIMGALFAALRFIVAQADRIIEARAAERRRFEIKLHQSERLASLGKMIAAVSHEIKNPLGIVSSTADILRKRLRDLAPENVHLAEIIMAETHRLDGIVMEFLDFARPQSPNFARTNLNDIIKKVSIFMAPEFDKHNISMHMDLSPTLPGATVDPNLLYRVFLNILVNSVQAMPKGGIVTITSRKGLHAKEITISFKDTGIGISEEKLEVIFNPFYTDKNRGTGLGLAIVKNIIDCHQGNIEVESKEGEFTTFHVNLPTKNQQQS